MNKKKKVSVIIPVYNVEKFVKQCILSVINQTYHYLEIIIVNDGSTDNSGKICCEYEKKDNRIKVYNKINGGLSSARNFGIAHASGDYIMFLDSDDMLTLNAVEILLNAIEESKAEICIGKGTTIKDTEYIKPELMPTYDSIKIYDKYEAIENALYEMNFSMSANMKIYKSNIFSNISFPVGKTFEDLFTIYKVFLNSKKTIFINTIIYYYRLRSGSIISNLNPLKNTDFLDAALEVQSFFREKNSEVLKAANHKTFAAAFELFVKYPRSSKEISKKDADNKKKMWDIIKKYRYEVLFNKKSKFKYRVIAIVSYFGQTILKTFYNLVAKR